VDGGARGNPGPAGFGLWVASPEGETLGRYFGYLGVQTNNVAEYRGLLAALEHAVHQGWRRLWVGSDSELMVRQVRGEYRVKNEGLRPLYERCRAIIDRLDEFTIAHLPREENSEADRLANTAMNLHASELPPGVRADSAPSSAAGSVVQADTGGAPPAPVSAGRAAAKVRARGARRKRAPASRLRRRAG
jgi:probable phosphoglycerate mutase